MKRLILMLSLAGIAGCRKTHAKKCEVPPFTYIGNQNLNDGDSHNLFTSDKKGRAEVRTIKNGSEIDIVFINGKWAERRCEDACN